MLSCSIFLSGIPLFEAVAAPLADTVVYFSKLILMVLFSSAWKNWQGIPLFEALYAPLEDTFLSLSNSILMILWSALLQNFTRGSPVWDRSCPFGRKICFLINSILMLEKYLPQNYYLDWLFFHFVFLLFHYPALEKDQEEASTRKSLHFKRFTKAYWQPLNLNSTVIDIKQEILIVYIIS